MHNVIIIINDIVYGCSYPMPACVPIMHFKLYLIIKGNMQTESGRMVQPSCLGTGYGLSPAWILSEKWVLVEVRRANCHTSLCPHIAIETSGGYGPEARFYLSKHGRRIQEETGAFSGHHLLQRIVVVQGDKNAAAVGTSS